MTGHPVRYRAAGRGPASQVAGFLALPERTTKPRRRGVSHVLDNGMSLAEAELRLASAAATIDVWKFGWGTAYVDPALGAKLELLAAHQVLACTGGTLLEVSWQQGVLGQFMDWAEAVGFPCIEVSCGSVAIPRDAKTEMIRTASSRFVVLSEIGVKNPEAAPSARQWGADARADLEAGARWVVTEGRESGTVGLYDPAGEVRTEIVDAVVSAVGLENVLFEAPRRDQQAWLIRRYGANVNLGNIAPADALAVETLRLGLRSDTMGTFPPYGEAPAGREDSC